MTNEEIQKLIDEFRSTLDAIAKKHGISAERSPELDHLIIEFVQDSLRRDKNGD